MSDNGFSTKIAFGWALDVFKQNRKYCLVVCGLAELITVLSALVLSANWCTLMMCMLGLDVPAPPETFLVAFLLCAALVRIFVDVIVVKIFALLSAGRKITFTDVLSFDLIYYAPLALRLFLTGILVNLSIGLSLVALVLPGVVLGSRWQLFRLAVVDTDGGVIEAIMDSARLTRPYKVEAIKLFALTAILRLVGLACFVIGFVPANALCLLAEAVTYKHLVEGPGEDTVQLAGRAGEQPG